MTSSNDANTANAPRTWVFKGSTSIPRLPKEIIPVLQMVTAQDTVLIDCYKGFPRAAAKWFNDNPQGCTIQMVFDPLLSADKAPVINDFGHPKFTGNIESIPNTNFVLAFKAGDTRMVDVRNYLENSTSYPQGTHYVMPYETREVVTISGKANGVANTGGLNSDVTAELEDKANGVATPDTPLESANDTPAAPVKKPLKRELPQAQTPKPMAEEDKFWLPGAKTVKPIKKARPAPVKPTNTVVKPATVSNEAPKPFWLSDTKPSKDDSNRTQQTVNAVTKPNPMATGLAITGIPRDIAPKRAIRNAVPAVASTPAAQSQPQTEDSDSVEVLKPVFDASNIMDAPEGFHLNVNLHNVQHVTLGETARAEAKDFGMTRNNTHKVFFNCTGPLTCLVAATLDMHMRKGAPITLLQGTPAAEYVANSGYARYRAYAANMMHVAVYEAEHNIYAPSSELSPAEILGGVNLYAHSGKAVQIIDALVDAPMIKGDVVNGVFASNHAPTLFQFYMARMDAAVEKGLHIAVDITSPHAPRIVEHLKSKNADFSEVSVNLVEGLTTYKHSLTAWEKDDIMRATILKLFEVKGRMRAHYPTGSNTPTPTGGGAPKGNRSQPTRTTTQLVAASAASSAATKAQAPLETAVVEPVVEEAPVEAVTVATPTTCPLEGAGKIVYVSCALSADRLIETTQKALAPFIGGGDCVTFLVEGMHPTWSTITDYLHPLQQENGFKIVVAKVTGTALYGAETDFPVFYGSREEFVERADCAIVQFNPKSRNIGGDMIKGFKDAGKPLNLIPMTTSPSRLKNLTLDHVTMGVAVTGSETLESLTPEFCAAIEAVVTNEHQFLLVNIAPSAITTLVLDFLRTLDPQKVYDNTIVFSKETTHPGEAYNNFTVVASEEGTINVFDVPSILALLDNKDAAKRRQIQKLDVSRPNWVTTFEAASEVVQADGSVDITPAAEQPAPRIVSQNMFMEQTEEGITPTLVVVDGAAVAAEHNKEAMDRNTYEVNTKGEILGTVYPWTEADLKSQLFTLRSAERKVGVTYELSGARFIVVE